MSNQTLTAPMAILKRSGKAIALMKSFTITENYQRGNVQGLGSLVDSEAPPLKIDCTASFNFYTTKFKDSAINDAINRGALSVQDFANNFILQDGISVDIYKRVSSGNTNAQGLRTADLELVGTITKMFITSDGMNLSEGAISDRTQSFKYLDPILYKDQG